MHIKGRNVNDIFRTITQGIFDGSIRTEVENSRVGEVARVPEPAIITYSAPRERVLFNAARDANPFMHMFEALWMLAGRRDIDPIAYYAENYRAQVQDGDSPYANGAYGYRWRLQKWGPIGGNHARVDQLKAIANHLKKLPHSRRAVLSMWNVEDDLLKVETTKDVCCNLSACFEVETGTCKYCEGTGLKGLIVGGGTSGPAECQYCKGSPHEVPRYLNMTVFNRSNDLIWGALGANVVHFSFLQEYMAARIGLEVGTYHQVSNNIHVYTERWEPEKLLADKEPNWYALNGEDRQPCGPVNKAGLFPFVRDPDVFDEEVAKFIDSKPWAVNWNEPFLQQVATPMCEAFHHHKDRRNYHGALKAAEQIAAADWRIAAVAWLRRREANWNRKQHAKSTRGN